MVTYHVGSHQLSSVLVDLTVPLQKVPIRVVGLPPLRRGHWLQLANKVELHRTLVGAEEQLAALLDQGNWSFEIRSAFCAGEHDPYICHGRLSAQFMSEHEVWLPETGHQVGHMTSFLPRNTKFMDIPDVTPVSQQMRGASIGAKAGCAYSLLWQ